jgi:putative phosphoribosyl transferase
LNTSKADPIEIEVRIGILGAYLEGILGLPENLMGIVLFAHGSGSSRMSSRNRFVAHYLQSQKIGTLLFDLLTAKEEQFDEYSGKLRFDISFLAARLVQVTDWLLGYLKIKDMKIGYFGASTGAAAALTAAVERPEVVRAIVSRGGRPDLAASVLSGVQSPVLLIVGGDDYEVIDMNRSALNLLRTEKKMVSIPGATHLFEETGALDKVARLAAEWFNLYFTK